MVLGSNSSSTSTGNASASSKTSSSSGSNQFEVVSGGAASNSPSSSSTATAATTSTTRATPKRPYLEDVSYVPIHEAIYHTLPCRSLEGRPDDVLVVRGGRNGYTHFPYWTTERRWFGLVEVEVNHQPSVPDLPVEWAMEAYPLLKDFYKRDLLRGKRVVCEATRLFRRMRIWLARKIAGRGFTVRRRYEQHAFEFEEAFPDDYVEQHLREEEEEEG